MVRPHSLRLVASLTLVVLLLASCGNTADDSADTTLAPTTTTLPPTTTAAPATTEPVPSSTEAAGAFFVVMFDGTECTTEGPTVVAAGDYPFVLTDLSDMTGADVRTQVLDDGYTYQDMLDFQGGAGEYFSPPEWAKFALNGFAPVEREMAENQTGKTIVLDTGLHAITVGTGRPSTVWLCGSLHVVAG